LQERERRRREEKKKRKKRKKYCKRPVVLEHSNIGLPFIWEKGVTGWCEQWRSLAVLSLFFDSKSSVKAHHVIFLSSAH
jgi:hypothetical protein